MAQSGPFDELDPRSSFAHAVAVYLRSLYPVDTESRVLADLEASGCRSKNLADVAQMLRGVMGPHGLDQLIGAYRMALVVGASELMLGVSVESFLERRGEAGGASVAYAMLEEAMAQARARAHPLG